MKFETVQIHYLSNVFGLLSSRNFATMAMWRNGSSSLLPLETILSWVSFFIYLLPRGLGWLSSSEQRWSVRTRDWSVVLYCTCKYSKMGCWDICREWQNLHRRGMWQECTLHLGNRVLWPWEKQVEQGCFITSSNTWPQVLYHSAAT